jgi:hypothetical protein
MENSSRFNLESAIGAWRSNLTGSSISGDSLLELESHLRDSIASLRGAGNAEEDAFALASYRLGQAHRLEEEYAKTHREGVWFERILWMLLGAQLFSFLTQVSGVIRGLLTVPQIMAENSALDGDPFGGFKYVLWLGQYLLLAVLLIGALRLLRNRGGTSTRFIEALRSKPVKWCGIMVGLSVALGMLSLGSSLLPMFVRDLMSGGATHTHYDYSNLLILVSTHFISALLLPAVMFWFLRRENREGLKSDGCFRIMQTARKGQS